MKYLNFSDLRAKLGNRSRTAVYLDFAAGRLPQPIKLGGRLYWIESEVEAHMQGLREQREQRNEGTDA
jgi:predicted DNA-binding transcriptional regulator AlpA